MRETLFTRDELQEISEWFYISKKFTGKGSKWIKSGLSQALRDKTDFVIVKRISKKTSAVNKKLLGLTRDQVRTSKVNIKGLVFEHIIPLKSIVERCLNGNTINEIKNILEEMEVVWITNDENNALKDNGFHLKERETREKAENAYNICGIKLTDEIF
jgi:hypothetical protein